MNYFEVRHCFYAHEMARARSLSDYSSVYYHRLTYIIFIIYQVCTSLSAIDFDRPKTYYYFVSPALYIILDHY